MPLYTDDDAARSLAAAALMAIGNLNPLEDWSGFADFDYDNGEVKRKAITDNLQTFPYTYGPESETWLIPGVVCEYSDATETRGKRVLDVTLSVSRKIEKAVEIEQSLLAQLTTPLYRLVYITECCPIYQFDWDGTTHNESISAIKGWMRWHQATMQVNPPLDRVVGERRMGGWLRREFVFQVRITNYEVAG